MHTANPLNCKDVIMTKLNQKGYLKESNLNQLRRHLILSCEGKTNQMRKEHFDKSKKLLLKLNIEIFAFNNVEYHIAETLGDLKISNAIKNGNSTNSNIIENFYVQNKNNIFKLNGLVYEYLFVNNQGKNFGEEAKSAFQDLKAAWLDYQNHQDFLQWRHNALAIINDALNNDVIKTHPDNTFFKSVQTFLKAIENFFNNLFNCQFNGLTNTFSNIAPTKEQSYFKSTARFFNVVQEKEMRTMSNINLAEVTGTNSSRENEKEIADVIETVRTNRI